MERIVIGCGVALALVSPTAMAQDAPQACYLQLSKLMADEPDGVGELGEALRRLDGALRPQVEEIKVLKAQLERIEERQREALESDEAETELVTLQSDAQRIREELEEKRNQLKLDYAAQREALVAPVQVRVSERARAFASENGCNELKMARSGDLAGLQATSARDMTPQFIAWYGRD